MIKEQAHVVALDGQDAIVTADRRSSCESCSINKGCGTSVLANVLGNKKIELTVRNDVGANIGEYVIIGIPEHVILRGSLLMYLLPIFGLMLGSVFGAALSPQLNLGDGFVAMSGMSGLLLGFLFVRFSLKQKSNNDQKVMIIERLSEHSHEHIIKINV